MLKKLSFGVILLACLVSCKSDTAYNYSQDIAAKENSLGTEITSINEKVTAFRALEQWDSIARVGERMEGLVGAILKEVKDKPAPNVEEGQNFKDACVRYFEYRKNIYTGYKNYGRATTPGDRAAELEKMVSVENGMQAEIDNIQSAQNKFAKANGFRIEGK